MDRDIKGAAALVTSASGGAVAYLTDRHVVSLTGDLFGDLHESYSGLDHVALGVTAAFRAKATTERANAADFFVVRSPSGRWP